MHLRPRRSHWLRLPGTLALLSGLFGIAVAESGEPPAPSFDARLKTGRESWAFSAPVEPPLPLVRDEAWCKSPVDRFILARLESRGLRPAPVAEKRTLIRRACFDLTGLPPTPGEVEAFVADDAPDAFARLVDRLLASPHYGERWARHWLDVVRYTDSFDARGVGSDGDVKYAWRYRDWVVKAFNQDLPYDQFVINQIAGDLLPSEQNGEPNADGIVATGMYVLGNWPGGEADREKMMTDIVDDQIDVTGRAFLGVTLACARCHDHKFDPISQQDYYGLAGILFSSHFLPSPGSKTNGSPLLVTPIASPQELQQRDEYARKLATLQEKLNRTTDEQYTRVARSLLPRVGDYLTGAIEFERERSHNPRAELATFARGRHLDAYVLARWTEYLGRGIEAQSPRKLLTRAIRKVGGIGGVNEWAAPDGRPDPCVIANSTDHPVSFSTITIPARSLSMHPGMKTGVAVSWDSPIAGHVQISGRVLDADPHCGDGINWRIEHARDRTTRMMAAGSFPNGGSQEFVAGEGGKDLARIEVRPGDALQLTIFPKGDYTCDSTVVDLVIAEADGEHRSWNLAGDVVADLHSGGAGNPHADGYGNPRVWSFFETGEERPATAAPGSALSHWLAAPSNESLENVMAALVASDAQASALREAGKNALELQGPDARLYQDWINPRGPFWGEARKSLAQLPAEGKEEIARAGHEVEELKKSAPPPLQQANALIEGGVPQSQYEGIHDCRLMVRGRYDRQGPVVPRGFPRLLGGDDPPPAFHGSGRLELARWVASPSNPMTAKVMANRIWQHHFGEGIVRTPNNFGKLGVPPTHPELLDYLARRFVEGGWSIKALHRTIMLSSAYQQSSVPDEATLKADPDNLLLGRMNRQRLEAEPFRDALLAVSGSLDKSMGGPAFRDPGIPRRTLYLMTIRSDRSNYRTLFDAADPTSIVDNRTHSTVAPQALFLMNDPFVLDRAKLLADTMLKDGSLDRRLKIERLYELLYSRPPTDREIEIGLSIVSDAPESWRRYCQVLLCANEFAYVD